MSDTDSDISEVEPKVILSWETVKMFVILLLISILTLSDLFVNNIIKPMFSNPTDNEIGLSQVFTISTLFVVINSLFSF